MDVRPYDKLTGLPPTTAVTSDRVQYTRICNKRNLRCCWTHKTHALNSSKRVTYFISGDGVSFYKYSKSHTHTHMYKGYYMEYVIFLLLFCPLSDNNDDDGFFPFFFFQIINAGHFRSPFIVMVTWRARKHCVLCPPSLTVRFNRRH